MISKILSLISLLVLIATCILISLCIAWGAIHCVDSRQSIVGDMGEELIIYLRQNTPDSVELAAIGWQISPETLQTFNPPSQLYSGEIDIRYHEDIPSEQSISFLVPNPHTDYLHPVLVLEVEANVSCEEDDPENHIVVHNIVVNEIKMP